MEKNDKKGLVSSDNVKTTGWSFKGEEILEVLDPGHVETARWGGLLIWGGRAHGREGSLVPPCFCLELTQAKGSVALCVAGGNINYHL